MENIKTATYYARKIATESRHKFIYAYNDNRDLLVQQIIDNYPIRMDDKPSALYLKLDGFPKIDFNGENFNKSAIANMSYEYFNLLIASELLKHIIDNNDSEKLKGKEQILLKFINSCMNFGSVKSLQDAEKLLRETKEMYYVLYLKYLQKGILEDPFEKTSLDFLDLFDFGYYTKEMLGKKNHISLVLDHRKEMCLDSYKAVNNLISSRINADFSVNILSEPDAWEIYFDHGRQLIEEMHDYESVDYDESMSKYMNKVKKEWQRRNVR